MITEENARKGRAKAAITNRRRGQERRARELVADGWTVINPYTGEVMKPEAAR